MPRVVGNQLALAATLCAAALALASCGGGSDAKLLPGETAQEISENLDSVQLLVDEGECIEAEDAALQVSTQVETLQGIDAELKRVLEEGAERLNEVVDTCEELTEDTVEETIPETTETTEEEPGKKEKKPKKVEPEETLPEQEEETEPEDKLPPQAKGEAKGHEKEAPPDLEESEEPSGGIGPGSAPEEGD